MIITGFRTIVSYVAGLFYACFYCQTEAPQRLYRARRWHTIFFVRIYPLGHGRYFTQCGHCGAELGIDRPSAEKFIADAEQFVSGEADVAEPVNDSTGR